MQIADTFRPLRVISRINSLALKQIEEIFSHFSALKYELITFESVSNKQNTISTLENPPHNIFTRELDQAILHAKADLAVHAAKELPYPLTPGLEVIALLENSVQTDSPGNLPNHPLQNHLAIVARANQPALKSLFASRDIRNRYGKVSLVGFGPGSLDLLTLGGDKTLSEADVIFHDALLDNNFLKKYWAEKIYVGKRKGHHSHEQEDINRLMLDAARAGKQVVRLKGGDPMVFAHGGEEVEYLQSNFVEVNIIPGVSAGIAVASLTKIPLTQRGIASSVAFVTGHSDALLIPKTDTLVLFMAGSNIRLIAQKAIAQGKRPTTPVMLSYNVSMPDQQEFFSTLGELSQSDHKFPTPIIIVIGDVVALRNHSAKELQKQIRLAARIDKKQNELQRAEVIHSPGIHSETE